MTNYFSKKRYRRTTPHRGSWLVNKIDFGYAGRLFSEMMGWHRFVTYYNGLLNQKYNSLRESEQNDVLFYSSNEKFGIKGNDRLNISRDIKPHAHFLTIPNFRIRARNVLRSSPRISAAPFFPLTFHWVWSSIWTI